jgi:hypothetical protein
MGNHVKRNGRATSTAKIKNRCAPWKETEETLDTGFIHPTGGTAVGIPRQRVALVMACNPICGIFQ